jgi:hypothetical protein
VTSSRSLLPSLLPLPALSRTTTVDSTTTLPLALPSTALRGTSSDLFTCLSYYASPLYLVLHKNSSQRRQINTHTNSGSMRRASIHFCDPSPTTARSYRLLPSRLYHLFCVPRADNLGASHLCLAIVSSCLIKVLDHAGANIPAIT